MYSSSTSVSVAICYSRFIALKSCGDLTICVLFREIVCSTHDFCLEGNLHRNRVFNPRFLFGGKLAQKSWVQTTISVHRAACQCFWLLLSSFSHTNRGFQPRFLCTKPLPHVNASDFCYEPSNCKYDCYIITTASLVHIKRGFNPRFLFREFQ